jgi:tetratricopeptide (TPR) repeat protein
MMRALERYEAGEARVIPVIVRPCDWKSAPFARFRGFPKVGRAVTLWTNHDEAWLDVAQGIRAKAADVRPAAPAPHSLPPRRPFTGRETELRALDELLASGSRTAVIQGGQAAVYGLGGVGKTAFALELAHRALARGVYPGGVFWLGASGKPRDVMKARSLLERALFLAQGAYGPDHPKVAVTLSNLALVMQDLGQTADARPLLERALELNEQAYGAGHHEVATSLSNLALLLQELGDAAAARPLLEWVLEIDLAVYGPEHPRIATSLSNLAGVLRELGLAARARLLLRRAVTIDGKVYGAASVNVASRLLGLATALQGASTKDAPAIIAKVLASVAGEKRADAARRLFDLTNIAVEDAAKAADELPESAFLDELLARARHTTYRHRSGGGRPRGPSTLGMMYAERRDRTADDIAHKLFREALALAHTSYGPDHPATAACLAEIAGALQHIAPHDQIKLCRQALSIE